MQAHAPGWLTELDVMEGLGAKAEIEALDSQFGMQGLSLMLQELIVHRDYLV